MSVQMSKNDLLSQDVELCNPYIPAHLLETERIKLGAFYTPPHIVKKVFELIQPYYENHKEKALIADLSAGCGAFVFPILSLGADYRVADYDESAINFLKKFLSHEKIFHTNSLQQASRDKFNIREDHFLIIVGNPPYNDITSLYKKGNKGSFECDPDLYDRDLGIAFLKLFAKLKADVICVVHPLSYLIKRANFQRLKQFTRLYKLKYGYIFPSSEFHFTKTSQFPILIALYERDIDGMSYEYIKSFRFKFLNGEKDFVLEGLETTDGYINKYPPRSREAKTSPIGLYFYSFRDLNSLLRNTTFIEEQKGNSVVITLENFYKYAYLHCLKRVILSMKKEIDYLWVYGNISPLVNKDFVEMNKKLFVISAAMDHKIFQKRKDLLQRIFEFYRIKESEVDLENIEKQLKAYFISLYTL